MLYLCAAMLDELLLACGFERSDLGVYFRGYEMVCLACSGEGQANGWVYFRDCLEISAVSGWDTAALSSTIGVAIVPTALAA